MGGSELAGGKDPPSPFSKDAPTSGPHPQMTTAVPGFGPSEPPSGSVLLASSVAAKKHELHVRVNVAEKRVTAGC